MARNVARSSRVAALACGILACAMGAGVAAQGQQVYRYVDPDGRVVYSDRAPPSSAKAVQPKRMGGNFIENDAMPLAARQASERYPVTLYTFACGEICQNAEALLNRRGVPFTTINVEEATGAEQLKRLTGEMTAPVLQVGDKLVAKGYNETRWQSLLDEAGYPKTAPARRTLTRPAAPATTTARTEPQAPPQPAPSPPPGGGYPKE
jgi:glutaredoxin